MVEKQEIAVENSSIAQYIVAKIMIYVVPPYHCTIYESYRCFCYYYLAQCSNAL